MTSGDQDYVQRLGQVLRQRDVEALRAFLEDQAGRYGDERQVEAIRAQSDAELEQILHRMILARPDLADLHPESQRQLGGSSPSGGPPPRRRRGRPTSANGQSPDGRSS